MKFKYFKEKEVLVKETEWGMKQTLKIYLKDGELQLEKMKTWDNRGSSSVTRFNPEEFLFLKKLLEGIEVVDE